MIKGHAITRKTASIAGSQSSTMKHVTIFHELFHSFYSFLSHFQAQVYAISRDSLHDRDLQLRKEKK